MRHLERTWRPWRKANQGSMRARWRRLSDGFSLNLPVAESAAVGVLDWGELREARRATGAFYWSLALPDDEPEPA